jgi:hypothetical protein
VTNMEIWKDKLRFNKYYEANNEVYVARFNITHALENGSKCNGCRVYKIGV